MVEITKIGVSSSYRKSTKRSYYIPRKVSLSKISEEESGHPEDDKISDVEQLKSYKIEMCQNESTIHTNDPICVFSKSTERRLRFIPETVEMNKHSLS